MWPVGTSTFDVRTIESSLTTTSLSHQDFLFSKDPLDFIPFDHFFFREHCRREVV
jgi:hypothetical protein